MLFTVVESRDARLVAESEDRLTKLTLEGGAAALGYTVGQQCWLSLLGQDVPVVATASGPLPPQEPGPILELDGGPNDPTFSPDETAALEGVTHDLSADPLAATVDEG